MWPGTLVKLIRLTDTQKEVLGLFNDLFDIEGDFRVILASLTRRFFQRSFILLSCIWSLFGQMFNS